MTREGEFIFFKSLLRHLCHIFFFKNVCMHFHLPVYLVVLSLVAAHFAVLG